MAKQNKAEQKKPKKTHTAMIHKTLHTVIKQNIKKTEKNNNDQHKILHTVIKQNIKKTEKNNDQHIILHRKLTHKPHYKAGMNSGLIRSSYSTNGTVMLCRVTMVIVANSYTMT